MTISRSDVIQYWIKPALALVKPTSLFGRMDLTSQGVLDLIAITGQVESRYEHLVQMGGGPALGFWQMEPATFRDHQAYLKAQDCGLFSGADPIILTRPFDAILMTRLHYFRRPGTIPQPSMGDAYPAALAALHKSAYNTAMGKADLTRNTAIIKDYLKT